MSDKPMRSPVDLDENARTKVYELSVGIGCNNRCIFCVDRLEGIGQDAKSFAIQNSDQLKRYLDTVPLDAWLRFGGHEPTTNSKLPLFIQTAYEMGFKRISVGSNGNMFSSMQYLNRLLDAGLNYLEISIHGDRPEIHDVLAGHSGSFALVHKALGNIRDVISQGRNLRFDLHCVILKQNAPYLEEILAFFNSYLPDSITLLYYRIPEQNEATLKEMVESFSSLVDNVANWSPRTLAMPIQILHIPLCISLQMPTKLFGQHETLHLMNKNRRSVWNFGDGSMTKRKACNDCVLKDYCPGVQSRYITHFGWDEFQPVTAEQWDDFLSRNSTETMLSDDDVRNLIAPFNETKPIGGWLLESIETVSKTIRVHFKHHNGNSLGLVLVEPNQSQAYATSERYAICFDGDIIRPEQEKFLKTIVRVIQRNDQRLCQQSASSESNRP